MLITNSAHQTSYKDLRGWSKILLRFQRALVASTMFHATFVGKNHLTTKCWNFPQTLNFSNMPRFNRSNSARRSGHNCSHPYLSRTFSRGPRRRFHKIVKQIQLLRIPNLTIHSIVTKMMIILTLI